MTTNKPGSVNQQPLYGCTNCYEDWMWPAGDLRVHDGECWCDLCWDKRRWEFPEQPSWNDLDPFTPALQAEYEEELFQVRQDRDTHFGEVMRALEQVDAMKAECEKLRKDAAAALSGLPDSLPMEPYQTVDRGSPHYKAGWNACRRAMLDALEKLMEDPIHDQ